MTVSEIVYRELPYLVQTPENDALIQSYKEQVMILLRSTFGKSDVEPPALYDENEYTPEQIILIGYYVVYDMLCLYILEQSTATSDASQGVSGQTVEEISTTTGKLKFSDSFTKAKAEELLGAIKTKLCAIASQIGYTLSICLGNDTQLKKGVPLLRTFPKRGHFKI